MKRTRLYISVFDCGLISKWDGPLPNTKQFTAQEGAPMRLELTRAQEAKIWAAQRRAQRITGYAGKVKLK